MRLILSVLGALLVCADASAATLVIGPFIRDVGPDRAVIAFETDVPTAAAVEVGETDAYGTSIPSGSTETWHEVTVTGLPPGTLRHYRVVLDGVPAGRAGTFITAPGGPEPFTFLVYGDNRSDPDAHAMVVGGMLQFPSSLVVNTGDIVTNGSQPELWTAYFAAVADLVGDTPIVADVGNHDMDGDGPPDTFMRAFGPATPGAGPATYRAFDYAGVRFLMLDRFSAITADIECIIRLGSFEQCMDAAQTTWLRDQLADARQNPAVKHVIVTVHEGPYSSKVGRYGAAEMRLMLNEFAASKVRMILSGHDHYYEHGIAGNGIHYVVTGGGGAPLYETNPPDGPGVPPHEVIMSTSVYHYLQVSVDGDTFEVTAWQADGTQMERFQVTSPPPCETAGDCEAGKAGSCPGAWNCGDTHQCLWACTPPPECTDAVQCEIRTPEEDCPGVWDCLEGKCTWICDAPPDVGPVDSAPSQDVLGDVIPQDPGLASDAVPVPDTPTPDLGLAPDTAAQPDNPPPLDPGLATDTAAQPDNPPPLDPGLAPDTAAQPDNPPPLDPGLAPDTTAQPDNPPPLDPGLTPDTAAQPDNPPPLDPGLAQDTGALPDTSPAKKSGGCSTTPVAGAPVALLPLLLLLPLAARRRR